MKQLWINKQQNRTCILFFNGWGMDWNAISHLNFNGSDLCMFNDFRSIEPISEDLTAYKTIILIAWSLGVWAAERAIELTEIKMFKSIAINGSPYPVHNHYGIPDDLFAMTIQGWDMENRNKFNRRMMGGKQNFSKYERFLSDRSIEEQKEELAAIYSNSKNNQCNIQWEKAIVGMNDLIFPSANQLNWWRGKTEITENQQPHFPFGGLQGWEQLIMS